MIIFKKMTRQRPRLVRVGLAFALATCLTSAWSSGDLHQTEPAVLSQMSQSLSFGRESSVQNSASGFPQFSAETCCQLCPQASDIRSYPSGFLSSFKVLVQGRDGWLFRSEDDLRMNFGADAEGLRLLREFRQTLNARGVELVLVMQPPRGLMQAHKLPQNTPVPYNAKVAESSYAAALEQIRSTGVIVPELEKLPAQEAEDDYFFRGDHHWTPSGSRRTAQVVADRIRSMSAYADLPKKKFETQRDGLLAKRGTMQKAARLICGFGASDQYVPRYVTTPAESSSSSALFDEEVAPKVTLVGTSNSEPAYNFGGFISEYLEADVLNVADAGGGMDGAMLSYLPSEEFQTNPPRILIWEIETYHNLSDPDFYRQAIPLVHNGCQSSPAVIQNDVTLRKGRNEVLFNSGVRLLRGDRHFLDLKLTGNVPEEIEAVVWYTDGNKDQIKLEKADFGTGDGRFVLNLRQGGDWGEQTFLSLDLVNHFPAPVAVATAHAQPSADAAAPLRVDAKLCSKSSAHANMAGRTQ